MKDNQNYIYAISANLKLAQDLQKKLNGQLVKINSHTFADREFVLATPPFSINAPALIVQSTSTPGDRRFLEIAFLANYLYRHKVKPIIAVIPYFGFARQEDKHNPTTVPSFDLILNMLSAAGISSVISTDIHAASLNSSIPFENISFAEIFTNYFLNLIKNKQYNANNCAFVLPDEGAVKRLESFLARFSQFPVIRLHKRRPNANEVELISIEGNIRGKTAIFLDDMIDTGGTIAMAATKLAIDGGQAMVVIATHGIFSVESKKHLNQPFISQIIVSDSIEKKLPKEIRSKVFYVSLAEILAKHAEKLENINK